MTDKVYINTKTNDDGKQLCRGQGVNVDRKWVTQDCWHLENTGDEDIAGCDVGCVSGNECGGVCESMTLGACTVPSEQEIQSDKSNPQVDPE